MNLQKLEKATKIYEEIKQLDKEIIEIDRFAMLVANGEIKASFELKVQDIGNQKEDAQKVHFDEDGSLIINKNETNGSILDAMARSWFSPFGLTSGEKKITITNEKTLKSPVSENTSMALLGVLLLEKKSKRENLISQLEKLGVSA